MIILGKPTHLPSSLIFPSTLLNHMNTRKLIATALLAAAGLQSMPAIAQTAGTGLRGEYFANSTHSGLPALTRTDATLAFDWQEAAPAPGLPNDDFSARWQGEIVAEFSETYTLVLPSDDGVRVWIDNVLILNEWTRGASGNREAAVALTANRRTPIRIDYFEGDGGANLSLAWHSNSVPWSIVPTARLFPAASVPQPTPQILTAIQKSQQSLRFTANTNSGRDVSFERAWALGTTHRCLVERSLDLQSWQDVSSLTTVSQINSQTAADTLLIPSYLSANDPKSGEPVCRAFYRVRYVPIQ
jgi:hypothetical protein